MGRQITSVKVWLYRRDTR